MRRTVLVTEQATTRAAVDAHLGIDLGGTAIKWALVGPEGAQVQGSVPTPRTGKQDVLEVLSELVSQRPSAGIGLALPGPVGTDEADELFVPNLEGAFSRSDLRSALGLVTPAPVELLNDAHAALLAELCLGAARAARDSVLITLGTGVGGAIARGGELHRGTLGRAGELGHLVVNPGGRPCACGERGCLETEASATAVMARARERVARDADGGLGRECDGDPKQLTIEDVVRVARQGDRQAVAIFADAGEAIGRATAALAATVAPELVVLGGGLAAAFDLLESPVVAVLARRRTLMPPCRLARAELGAGSGALGAALWSARSQG